MFDVISSSKNTQWLTFPSLDSKYTYSHVDNESVDFQIIPGQNGFVEFNKSFGFELLRAINKDNKDVIQRVKKRQFTDLSCGAISKLCGSEIAIGTIAGNVRIFNVQSGEYMPIKLKPDQIGNSVVGLDYSKTDEFLAAVYDSSDINIFSLKSNSKVNSFRFKGQSTLVRFHPVREFALAVGSYEGAITMVDTQTKQKLFYDELAHRAPVRDISMFDSSDVFVSCSYDSKINVYDIRKKSVVQQHKQNYPLSSVCISPCGSLCVAGNLKGDVIAFDFRSMKEPLNINRIYDSAVVRVAFISTSSSNANIIHDSFVSANSGSVNSLYKSVSSASSASRQSSGLESFDTCHRSTIVEEVTPKNRNSWADIMPIQKIHDFSMDSIAETPSQISSIGDFQSDSQISFQSRFSSGQSISNDHTEQKPRASLTTEKAEKQVIEPKRRRMTEIVALEGIQEEEVSEMSQSDEFTSIINPTQKKWLHTVDHKEFADGFAAYIKQAFDENPTDQLEMNNSPNNREVCFEEDKENQRITKPIRLIEEEILLTPNRQSVNSDLRDELVVMSTREFHNTLSEIIHDKIGALETEFEIHMRRWQENMKAYVATKLKELSNQVGFMQSRNFHSDFNHRFRNHMELEQELDMFDEGFAALLHVDSVEEQFSMYKNELENLRGRCGERKFNTK